MRMLVRTAAAALMLALGANAGFAQTPFFQNKQLKVLVGFPPGGGTDLYGRVIADGLARHVEGKPAVIVQNMPGAGSLRAVNYLYNVAPKDGATIGTFARNMPLIGLLGGNSNVQFNPRRFTWLGSTSSFVQDGDLARSLPPDGGRGEECLPKPGKRKAFG